MRQTYHATFRLGSLESPASPTVGEFAALCREWVVSKPRPGVESTANLPVALDEERGKSRFFLGAKASLETFSFSNDNLEFFGVKFQHADRNEQTATWLSELVLARNLKEGFARVSASLSFGRSSSVLAPLPSIPSRPSVVPQMVEKWGAHEDLTLRPTPWSVNGALLPEFVSLIRSRSRRLPIIFVSACNADGRPTTNAKQLARQLVGLCHVFVAESASVSTELESIFPRPFNCWDGAIRIYWPNFSETDDRFHHRLWTPDQIQYYDQTFPGGFKIHLLGVVSKIAVSRNTMDAPSCSEIEAALHRKSLDDLRKSGGDLQSELELFLKENERLESEGKSLRAQLADAEERAERAANDAESWREAHIAYKQASERGMQAVETETYLPPTSVREVVELVRQEFCSTIAFELNGASEWKNNPFMDSESLYKALRFLATAYVEAKSGRCPMVNIDDALNTESGFRYEPHQSEATMKRFSNEYQTDWNGKKVWLEGHIKKGTSREARYSIRVGFHYDEESEKLVIGYIGQHQTTANS